MTVSKQMEEVLRMEEILGETIAALSLMKADELEELERRAVLIAESLGTGRLPSTLGLRSKAKLLEGCLGATERNLKVLERLRERKVAV